MHSSMVRLIERLIHLRDDDRVIGWATPVPFFGTIGSAKIATVGINPSNLEFVDNEGAELDGSDRRLPTLRSLEIPNWDSVDGDDLRVMLKACESYFTHNPYRRWFDVLERVLERSEHSYYSSTNRSACHLDLVPFATSIKWSLLPTHYRRALTDHGRTTMAEFIRDSPIEVLVLNGRSVVSEFESFAGDTLGVEDAPEWSLKRDGGKDVPGLLYSGEFSALGTVELERPIRVIGYNHNLQSSFGVTSNAIRAIGDYLGDQLAAAPHYPSR